MDDINIVILSGVIKGTPEVRKIGQKQTQVCSGQIQSKRSFTYNGATKESTTTKNFKAFGKAGELLANLRGGDYVRINGRLTTESWDSKKEPGKKEYREIIEVLEATSDAKHEEPKRGEEDFDSVPQNADIKKPDEDSIPF